MNKIVSLLYIISFLLLSGCYSNHPSTNIDNDMVKAFKLYGRNANIDHQIFDSIISFNIYVYSPSFLDVETQKLLLSLVCYENKRSLNQYQTMYFDYVDQGFEKDIAHYSISHQELKSIVNKFETNRIFLDLCFYSFNDVTNDDLIKYNLIIHELNSLMPNDFNFQGSFWFLLYKVSEERSIGKQKYYNIFKMFDKASTIPEYELNHKKIEKMCKILDAKQLRK